MTQEDLNDMMKTPEEALVLRNKNFIWNKCPNCRKNYCGDGLELCEECEAEREKERGQ